VQLVRPTGVEAGPLHGGGPLESGCVGEEAEMGGMFERLASRISSAAGRPMAFMLALGVIVVWGASGPLFKWSDTWQLVINTGTTIVTFLMVFLIQNAQNRDASAIQAKLDELIRSVGHARNEFIGIEHLTEVELAEIREALEKDAGDEPTRHQAILRLIARR
jgi:low affinity Fe/Cu permease